MLVLGGCIGQVLGSEKNDEIITFKANVGTLNDNPLRYCDSTYVDFLRNDYGIQCKYNEPFLMIHFSLWTRGIKASYISTEEQALREVVEPITFVPYRYFIKNDTDPKADGVSFKQQNDILLSFSKLVNTDRKFQMQLDSDFEDFDPHVLLKQFKENPRCEPGNILNERGSLLAYVDTTKVEKELCDAGIILLVVKNSYKDGKPQYEQWVNGYFGDEIRTEIKEKVALFYSRLKTLFFGGSIAAILAYVFISKFYATAG